MADRRHKDKDWQIADETGALYPSYRDGAFMAVMMDIRDELNRMNRLLHCHNFIEIPTILRSIRRKVPARKPRRRKG